MKKSIIALLVFIFATPAVCQVNDTKSSLLSIPAKQIVSTQQTTTQQRAVIIYPKNKGDETWYGGTQETSILVYNRTFAKRFALDENKAATDLDPKLEAVELIISKRKPDDDIQYQQYDCHLNLYTNSTLNIRFPEGSFGDEKSASELSSLAGVAVFDRTKNFYPAIPPIPEPFIIQSDSEYESFKQEHTHYYRALIGQTLPESTLISYERYRKEWLPGISYISLDLNQDGREILGTYGCKLISSAPNGTSIWLEKKSNPAQADPVKDLDNDIDNKILPDIYNPKNTLLASNYFYQFNLPSEIIHAPELLHAQQANKQQYKNDLHKDIEQTKKAIPKLFKNK